MLQLCLHVDHNRGTCSLISDWAATRGAQACTRAMRGPCIRPGSSIAICLSNAGPMHHRLSACAQRYPLHCRPRRSSCRWPAPSRTCRPLSMSLQHLSMAISLKAAESWSMSTPLTGRLGLRSSQLRHQSCQGLPLMSWQHLWLVCLKRQLRTRLGLPC